MTKTKAAAAATLALICAGAVAAPAGAADPVRKRVKVADNFFSPKRFSVPVNSTIVWKWSRLNGETHDVFLLRKPKGVKRFQSAPAATGFTFKRKLRKAGTYRMICTFHEDMAMRVTVTR
jgi:plastocyanin